MKKIMLVILICIIAGITCGCSNSQCDLILNNIEGEIEDDVTVKVYYQEYENIFVATKSSGKSSIFHNDEGNYIDCGLEVMEDGIFDKLVSLYKYDSINDFFLEYGQPVKTLMNGENQYLIMDGWPVGKQNFFIISFDDVFVGEIEKKNFDEICTNVQSVDNDIRIYTGWYIYDWNTSSQSVQIEEYINNTIIKIPKNFDIIENKLSEYKSVNEYNLMITNCFKQDDNDESKLLCVQSVITQQKTRDGQINFAFQDDLCISSVLQDAYIYTISYKDNLTISKYSSDNLQLIDKIDILLPFEIADKVQYSIDVTPLYKNGKWYCNFSPIGEFDGVVKQYIICLELESMSLDYAGELVLPSRFYFREIVIS